MANLLNARYVRCTTLVCISMSVLVGCNGGGDSTSPPVTVATVLVTPSTADLRIGDAQALQASVKDGSGNLLSGRTMDWSTSAPGVASVSAAGVVTALSPGSASISATVEGKIGSSTINVSDPVSLLTITSSSTTVLTGHTLQLGTIIRSLSGGTVVRPVVWTSTQEGVATVSSTGLVTAVSVGTTQINAVSEGVTASATLQVELATVASVAVNSAAQAAAVGRSYQATATTRDALGATLTGRNVTWSSSNQAIATVSNTGLVQVIDQGDVAISGTSEGKSGARTFFARHIIPFAANVLLDAAQDEYFEFFLEVPPGTARLTVTLVGNNGDADLYLALPQTGYPTEAVCGSESNGSNESCVINNPVAGLWWMQVVAFDTFTGVTLRASLGANASTFSEFLTNRFAPSPLKLRSSSGTNNIGFRNTMRRSLLSSATNLAAAHKR